MAKRTIVTLPGDGIGAVVLREALRVLDAAGFEADYIHGDIGWEFWCREGNPLPKRTIDLIEKHKIALFGAITSKPNDEAKSELSPELQGKGYSYSSPIVGLRQLFNLDICVRPCKSYKGNPLNFVRRGKGNTIDEPLVDVVIFRQNTEGLYSGVEILEECRLRSCQYQRESLPEKRLKEFFWLPLNMPENMDINLLLFAKNQM